MSLTLGCIECLKRFQALVSIASCRCGHQAFGPKASLNVVLLTLLVLFATPAFSGCNGKPSVSEQEADDLRMTYLLLGSIDFWSVELDAAATKKLAAENLYQVETCNAEYTHMSPAVRRLAEEFIKICYARIAHQERWDRHREELASVIKDENPSEGEKFVVMSDSKRLGKEREELGRKSKEWRESLMAYCDTRPKASVSSEVETK